MSDPVIQPVPFLWVKDAETLIKMLVDNGAGKFAGAMVANRHYRRIMDRQFEDGGVYLLEPATQEHDALRRAFFAQLREVFKNLPEYLEERFPSELHLRKWLLVQVGYCDEANYVCSAYKDAETLALAARKLDEFAVIELKRVMPEEDGAPDVDLGGVVRIRTAKSQKRGKVKPAEAKDVIDAVLNRAAALIGTTRADMRQHVGNEAPKQIEHRRE